MDADVMYLILQKGLFMKYYVVNQMRNLKKRLSIILRNWMLLRYLHKFNVFFFTFTFLFYF
ncbi:MAG: hypothetical protein V1663_05780 [archaeon]